LQLAFHIHPTAGFLRGRPAAAFRHGRSYGTAVSMTPDYTPKRGSCPWWSVDCREKKTADAIGGFVVV